MQIAILLYDGFTTLDAMGPFDVLSRLPGAEVSFVASEPGLRRTDAPGLAVDVERSLDDLPKPDVILVPGGTRTVDYLEDERLLGWLRRAHETSRFTTSVCTGALLLGAAGLLRGLEATTHWYELESLSGFGARPARRRVVEQGKIITAAGVSAGIDMALTLAARLAGRDTARAIELVMEYDPDPPFGTGSPQKAPLGLRRDVEASMRSSYGSPLIER